MTDKPIFIYLQVFEITSIWLIYSEIQNFYGKVVRFGMAIALTRLTIKELPIGNLMNRITKFSLQIAVLMGLTLPHSASAGILADMEAQCLCLTEHATVGQMVSLGVMLVLIAGIIVLKFIYRNELDQAVKKEKKEAERSAIELMKELKIGTRFSDWSHCNRLAGQK